jgi:hypothetical protein
MKNTELERIATMLSKRDTYEIESDLVDHLWNYLVDCGIDPEDYRPKSAPTRIPEPGSQFVVGQELSCRSLGDWDCVFRFTVVKRTAKFVTLLYHGIENKVAIRHWSDGVEYCYPLGTYSMAPALRSDSEVL